MKSNPWPPAFAIALLVFAALPLGKAAANAVPSSRLGLAAWDTGAPSGRRLEASTLAAKKDWIKLPRSERTASFRGDAVMSNGRVLAVLRKHDAAVDVYADQPAGPIFRTRLHLVGPDGKPARRLIHLGIVENTRGAVRLEAKYESASGPLAASFRLKREGVLLEVRPGAGADRLRVECPSRFLVLPDFFADDILIDARRFRLDALELPSEHFLLHLLGAGDTIAMCVFENNEQDVHVALGGRGSQRMITGSEIRFGNRRKIWLALLHAPHIWHSLNVRAEHAEKVIALDGKMPFDAQWRVDFTRKNDLVDSWEMLLPNKHGSGFVKPAWLGRGDSYIGADRKRWTTVLGRFRYPCWTGVDGQGYLQPLKHESLEFRGPAIVYPVNRVQRTPFDAYTVVDVLRNSLGVGPCEYILNIEGHRQQKKGRATCSARDALQAIYKNKQQRRKRKEIEAALDEALEFVRHIRGRITRYVEFSQEIREYLAEQRKAHPESAEFLEEMDGIARQIDEHLRARKDRIKTPEIVAQMNEDFRKSLLDYHKSDVMQKLKGYTDALTRIGGNQDELVGECRWVARRLRQRAGVLMAMNPSCSEIAEEIRERTQKVLVNPSTYEAARH